MAGASNSDTLVTLFENYWWLLIIFGGGILVEQFGFKSIFLLPMVILTAQLVLVFWLAKHAAAAVPRNCRRVNCME